jgi:hypothetical protein
VYGVPSNPKAEAKMKSRFEWQLRDGKRVRVLVLSEGKKK